MTNSIKWNKRPDMVAYMMEIIPGHEEYQIKELFQNKFGILLTESQIGNFKHNHHIRSGTHGGQFKKGQVSPTKGKKMPKEVYEKVKHTMFQKGHVPHNHKEIGSERVNIDGYVEIKVAEPDKWMLKSRYLYEQHHNVKLTRNDVIVFLDGNKLNLDINNLFLISRAALARFNQDKLYSDNPEITKAAALMAELKTKTHVKKRKEDTNGINRPDYEPNK